jgi:hypothetical protein
MSPESDDMTGNRVTRASAERLLDTFARGTPPSGDSPDELLGALLAAVPGRMVGESEGERAAVAAWRAARASSPKVPARGRLTKIVTIKLAVVAAVLTGGGVAAAGSTGILPHLFTSGPQTTMQKPTGVPLAHPTGGVKPHSSTAPPRMSATPPGGSPPAQSSGPPPGTGLHGSLVSACRAYLKLPPDDRAGALGQPKFRKLLDAAGGADRVDAFCAGTPSSASPAPPARHIPPIRSIRPRRRGETGR